MRSPSLYIHIPFCRAKCGYCDFYSIPYDEALASSYVKVLRKELERLDGGFSSVYVGGGTPSVLGAGLLKDLLGSLKRFCGPGVEATVEANPESADAERLGIFLSSGINRLSLGIQSFDDKKLAKLGRVHDSAAALGAVDKLVRSGFKNIGIDLIYGVWDETPEDWEKELAAALRLPVKHISCYSLTYEKGTPLYGALDNGAFKPLADETVAAMYRAAVSRLAADGFGRYEVSNFAKEGFECRHNMNYWANYTYTGLGASAVSYRAGSREKNISDLREYIRRVERGENAVESSEKLEPAAMARETAAIGIRTRRG